MPPYRDEQDKEIGSKDSELYGCFDSGKDKQHAEYDLINDIGIYPRTNDDEELVVKRLKDADFRKLVQSSTTRVRKIRFAALLVVGTGPAIPNQVVPTQPKARHASHVSPPMVPSRMLHPTQVTRQLSFLLPSQLECHISDHIASLSPSSLPSVLVRIHSS